MNVFEMFSFFAERVKLEARGKWQILPFYFIVIYGMIDENTTKWRMITRVWDVTNGN